MNMYRTGLAAVLVTAVISGLVTPAVSASNQFSSSVVLPAEDTSLETATSETAEDSADEAPTRDDVINYGKTFTSRSSSDIALARKLAPKNYPGYFKTSDYAKWYAAKHVSYKYDWLKKNFSCLDQIWQAESSWRIAAVGAGGLYLGIPQLNRPAVIASGVSIKTYSSSVELQVQLGAKYVKYRYGNPCDALAHKKAKGWY